ncbi:MAG: hypothetical protein ACREF0_13410, partial [Acetobacteraceae bacterium]
MLPPDNTGGSREAPKPKADAPKADAPKADAPKADAPKADAPRADAPKATGRWLRYLLASLCTALLIAAACGAAIWRYQA